MCKRDGRWTDGSIPVELNIDIPSVAAAQKYMTGDVTAWAAQDSGSDITDLTITTVRLA